MACHIVFVLFPAFQQLDLAGPMAAFELAERARPGSYRWRLVARGGGRVRSSVGVEWPVQALPRSWQGIHIVMVIGGDGVDAAGADPLLTAWLRRAASAGSRITSICSGSLVLAAAGLLDGRAATTHWSRRRQFEAQHPSVNLQPDRIYVHEPARRRKSGMLPEVWTSAGMTAGIDLCLALIGHDQGESLAREVARQLVVEHRRPGGQSQFSTLLDLQRPDGRFGPLLEDLREQLDQDLSVDALATRACMSTRNFARAFRAETGTSPAQAVERMRVEAARAALDRGGATLQHIARACGFGNPERMRRAFLRRLGRPPAQLRQRPAAE